MSRLFSFVRWFSLGLVRCKTSFLCSPRPWHAPLQLSQLLHLPLPYFPTLPLFKCYKQRQTGLRATYLPFSKGSRVLARYRFSLARECTSMVFYATILYLPPLDSTWAEGRAPTSSPPFSFCHKATRYRWLALESCLVRASGEKQRDLFVVCEK